MRGFTGEAVLHRGTGELLKAEGPWRFEVGGKGFALLLPESPPQPPDVQSFWVAEKGDWLLYQSDGARPRLFLRQKRTGEIVWRTRVQDEFRWTKAFGWADSTGFRWVCDVFISRIPLGLASVRWSVKDSAELLIGSCRDGRWMSKRAPYFASWLDKVGLTKDHLVAPQASARARAPFE